MMSDYPVVGQLNIWIIHLNKLCKLASNNGISRSQMTTEMFRCEKHTPLLHSSFMDYQRTFNMKMVSGVEPDLLAFPERWSLSQMLVCCMLLFLSDYMSSIHVFSSVLWCTRKTMLVSSLLSFAYNINIG